MGELDDEPMILIKGSRSKDYEELFSRSVIATTSSSLSFNQILDHILAEGVTCLTIKPIGGMLHLITFASFEDKKEIWKSKRLDRWFIDIRNVNNVCATHWKETWVKIYGVPLTGWGYKNFYDIG